MKCRNGCDPRYLKRKLQTFRNGATHIRVDCGRCGNFVQYDKQGINRFREEMFSLVRAISEAECSVENMRLFRYQARVLMEKANDEPT